MELVETQEIAPRRTYKKNEHPRFILVENIDEVPATVDFEINQNPRTLSRKVIGTFSKINDIAAHLNVSIHTAYRLKEHYYKSKNIRRFVSSQRLSKYEILPIECMDIFTNCN